MDKRSTEDDWVDSGAETGGSDYSPMSSASKGDSSMCELQDPFLVSVHLIVDPGQGRFLQRAADAVLAWVHPELQLFRVSERAFPSASSSLQQPRARCHQNGGLPPSTAAVLDGRHPSLAVVLFLQEVCGGEEPIAKLHGALQQPPWSFHHTEKVSGKGRRVLPLAPCSQDFYTLAPGTPLWAVRQVHYGKEIVRFTIYCSHDNYGDMVRLYKLLLQRRLAQKKEDFCSLVVYANPDTEIQLSFKRLPRGQSPAPTASGVMEIRVRDVGSLVPLLPQPCSPISEVRWQTEDYDGNKILLQVQGARFKRRQDASQSALESFSAPSTFSRSSASYRNRRYHRMASRCRAQNQTSSYSSLPLACEELAKEEEEEQWAEQRQPEAWRTPWRSQRSDSLFSLANPAMGSSRSTSSSPGLPSGSYHRSHALSRSSSLIPPFRLNLDALIGTEETDVDTGYKVDTGNSVDLTVVSAYIKPSVPFTPRPSSAPPEDIGPSLSPGPSAAAVPRACTLGRPRVPARTSSLSSKSIPSTLLRPHPQSPCINTSGTTSPSDVSLYQWDSFNSLSESAEHSRQKAVCVEEEDQEFYI